jgi:hypothetical protein
MQTKYAGPFFLRLVKGRNEMTDPRKSSYESSNIDFDTPRFFSDFPRIQVKSQRMVQEQEFKSLSTPERQELLEKLIDHVRDL